jgi:heptosyltransferase-2
LARALRGGPDAGYSRAYVLPNSWKSALVPWLAGIARRTGYRGESRWGLLNDARRLDRKAQPRLVDRFVALAAAPDAPLPIAAAPVLVPDAANRAAAAQALGLQLDPPIAILCPGAEYGPAKRWPYFKELAERCALPVVLVGSAKDREHCAAVKGRNLAGETTLDEAIELIAGAQLVVANDSGLMHVAAALGRPQVALFGSSSPKHTPPLSAKARVLWLGIECSPCYARECPLGHFRCMRELGVEQVLAKMGSDPIFQK